MMVLLKFLFFAFVFLLILGVVVVIGIFSLFSGLKNKLFGRKNAPGGRPQNRRSSQTDNTSSSQRKIIADDEGEYVDYEEV